MVRDKLREVVEGIGGRDRPVARREVIRYFRTHFPEVAEGSILPADHCINLVRGRAWDRDMGLPLDNYFLYCTQPGYYELYDPAKHGPAEKWLAAAPMSQPSFTPPSQPALATPGVHGPTGGREGHGLVRPQRHGQDAAARKHAGTDSSQSQRRSYEAWLLAMGWTWILLILLCVLGVFGLLALEFYWAASEGGAVRAAIVFAAVFVGWWVYLWNKGRQRTATAESGKPLAASTLAIAVLWDCRDEAKWKDALARYWDHVKPGNAVLEEEMNNLSLRVKQFSDVPDWYSFLLNKYFVWKYTAPNRLATTTAHFRKEYESYRASLHDIMRGIFTFDRSDIREGLSRASQIKGLGIAGASGLLALLFPEYFGTVDQFVVKALQQVSRLDQIDRILEMNPQGLTVSHGVILISIMRRKARELNDAFNSTFWTPRKIDVVLWALGH